jgi:hypothetical protein
LRMTSFLVCNSDSVTAPPPPRDMQRRHGHCADCGRVITWTFSRALADTDMAIDRSTSVQLVCGQCTRGRISPGA